MSVRADEPRSFSLFKLAELQNNFTLVVVYLFAQTENQCSAAGNRLKWSVETVTASIISDNMTNLLMWS